MRATVTVEKQYIPTLRTDPCLRLRELVRVFCPDAQKSSVIASWDTSQLFGTVGSRSYVDFFGDALQAQCLNVRKFCHQSNSYFAHRKQISGLSMASSMAAATLEDGPEILLDWRIKVFVLLPITLATLVTAILRQSLSALMMQPSRVNLFNVRDAAALNRASNLRDASGCMHPAQFEARRDFLAAAEGPLMREALASAGPLAMLMNPEVLANQVTGLMTSTVPSMLLGAWANYFFRGFAVCRLPFPVSQRFRGMMQSGIERVGQSLNVRYVSALSWYVINLFGNGAIAQILMRVKYYSPGGHSDPAAYHYASRLAAVFRGANDAREKEKTALKNHKYKYVLRQIEKMVLSSDPTAPHVH